MKNSIAYGAFALCALSIGFNVGAIKLLTTAGQNMDAYRTQQAKLIDDCAQGANVYPTSCQIQAVVVKGPAAESKMVMLNPPSFFNEGGR